MPKNNKNNNTLEECRKELEDAKTRFEIEVSERTKKLKSENARLKESAYQKDEFIRITNHELRTPLDIIRGNIDIVLKGEAGEMPDQAREYLEDTLMGADRLTKLVNHMLDISRIETGRMTFTLETVDIVKFLKTIKKEFAPIAKSKQLDLRLEIPTRPLRVFSDRARLFQILDNFLGNALKFTPAGGMITIRLHDEDEMAVFSVQDTGIGIRPEDQNKLFKQFSKIDIDTSKIPPVKGTGLGLALVRQLVSKLGGEVWVESEGLEKGTTFFFRIPLSGTGRADALARYHDASLSSGDESVRRKK